MAVPTFTLRTVTGAGALDKPLPDFESLDVSPVFSQAGTVVVKYPSNGVNFNLLHDDVELAVLMDGVEVGELRCIVESSDGNDASEAEEGSVWTFTARTMLGLLDRAVVYPQFYPMVKQPNHSFVDATPGRIMIDLMDKAQTRGALTNVTLGFTATHDSNGDAWSSTWDISFDAGKKYTEVVQDLVDIGAAEVTTDGREILMYNVDGLGTDKSTGANPLKFLKGRDIKDSPRKSSTRELATAVLVSADNNMYREKVSFPGVSQWGRREASWSQSGIGGGLMLEAAGGFWLQTMGRPVTEVTHGLYFEDPDSPKPIVDFNTGDWGLSDVGRGWESLRIKQWAMSIDNAGQVSGSVVLNDLIEERQNKLRRWLERISNGSAVTGSSEEKDDGKAPAVPTSISLGSQYYLDGERARALLTVQWAHVTTNADGTALSDLEGYQVRWKYASDTAWRLVQNVEAGENVVLFSNINTGSNVNVQVAAFDRYGRFSGWSPSSNIATAADTEAPERPSAPVVTSNVGTLRATWDGLDHAGNAMAADLLGVEVHVGPNGTFTPNASTQKDFLKASAPTSVTITGLSYGTEYWVRLVAVDTSGNKSAGSSETSTSHAVLKPVVNVEIGTGEVGLSQVRFSDVGNLVEDGTFENAALRVSRQAQFTSHMSFDNTAASNGTWSFKVVGQGPSWPTEELVLQSGLQVKPGERVFGAADYKASTDADESSSASLIVRWYDKDGVLLTDTGTPGSVSSAWYVLATTNFNQVPRDNTWYRRVTNTSKLAPPNAASMSICLRVMTHFSGTLWVDAVEVRKQVDTLLIGDAAITSAKIALLAVNDAHIANLNVGKLVTGTLNADMTVSARIKTADFGERAEMSAAGFEAYNDFDVRTFRASSTGIVTIVGELKSGVSGKRVEINPGSTGLPEIRLYPGSGSNFGFLNAIGDGSSVSVGLNSGTFTVASTTASNRLYMGDDFCKLQVIRASNQDTFGGYLSLRQSEAKLGRDTGSNNDSNITFSDDGKIRFIGEIDYWNSGQNAILAGNVSWSNGPFSAVIVSYATTLDSAPRAIAQMNDTVSGGSGIATSVHSLSTTGFTAALNPGSSGADGSLHWWAWRL